MPYTDLTKIHSAKPPEPAEEPETPPKNGRPFHAPTDDKRACVLLMAGMGAAQLDIAKKLRIGIHTLRRDYADELSAGRAEIDAEAYAALRRGLQKDDPGMIKFYLTSRCGWKADPLATVNISMTVTDILHEISGQQGGLPDVKKQPKTVEHVPNE